MPFQVATVRLELSRAVRSLRRRAHPFPPRPSRSTVFGRTIPELLLPSLLTRVAWTCSLLSEPFVRAQPVAHARLQASVKSGVRRRRQAELPFA